MVHGEFVFFGNPYPHGTHELGHSCIYNPARAAFFPATITHDHFDDVKNGFQRFNQHPQSAHVGSTLFIISLLLEHEPAFLHILLFFYTPLPPITHSTNQSTGRQAAVSFFSIFIFHRFSGVLERGSWRCIP